MNARRKDDKGKAKDDAVDLPEQPEESAVEPVTEAESDDPIERLETELQAARLEAVEAREDMLRMQADMENLRKRLVREIRRFTAGTNRLLEMFALPLLGDAPAEPEPTDDPWEDRQDPAGSRP